MPWHIEKRGDEEWCVIKDDDGSTEDCHETEEKAKRHMRALYSSESSAAKQVVLASFPTALARSEARGRVMVGYATVWDVPIEGGGGWFPVDTMYLRTGAFKKSLKEQGAPKVLFNHGHDPQLGMKPLGKPTVVREDDYGLWTETPLDKTSWADDIVTLLESGALDSMSVTFEAKEYAYLDEGDAMSVTQARLYEFGPVTFPAAPGTSATLHSLTAFDALRSEPDEARRADGPSDGGRPQPPPTLAAITWRQIALHQLSEERRFTAELAERTRDLARRIERHG